VAVLPINAAACRPADCDEPVVSTGSATTPAGGWLAGLLLGALCGLTTISFALGAIGIPIIVASVLLILVKGPRLTAGAALLTGWGLVWTVLIVNSTVSCLTIDRGPGRWCEPADGIEPFLLVGAAMFVVGLVASALALRRSGRP
jgi:hypothetical protein